MLLSVPLLCFYLTSSVTAVEIKNEESLCSLAGCSCIYNNATQLVSVSCSCQRQHTLRIGVQSDTMLPPDNGESLSVENCSKLEIFPKILNHMPDLKNITIKNCKNVILHPKLFEARGGSQQAGILSNVQFTNIKHLDVKRYSFKDVSVRGMFYLEEVHMNNVMSLAFHMDYVGEFSVISSKFERISMFGIKIAKCLKFNILGMTHFSSLAAHAIKLQCEMFSLAYNWFGHLHDSSFDVEYSLCDIQGNTFYSLAGKPFLNLKQSSVTDESSNKIPMTGFVFRENKFVSEPVLPFASLLMPHYKQFSYVDVEDNQFTCNCLKIGWLLAFVKFGHNSHTLAQTGSSHVDDVVFGGSTAFIKDIFENAGPCLECDSMECHDSSLTLAEFADEAVFNGDKGAECSKSGMVIRNYDDTASLVPADVKRDEVKTGEIVTSTTVSTLEERSKSDLLLKESDRTTDRHLSDSEHNERIIVSSDSRKCFLNIFLFSFLCYTSILNC